MGDVRVSQLVVETVSSIPSDVRVSQVVVEVLNSLPSDVRVSQFGVEIVTRNDDGNISINAPTVSGSGAVVPDTGNIFIDAPTISGTATVTVSGSGGVDIGPPTLGGDVLVGPIKLTQMGRNTLTANDDDTIKVTQLGRTVVQEFDTPSLRLTQMARQVIYPYVCATEPAPPLLDTPIVYITNIRPLWQLERMDVKRRGEDTAAATKTNSYSSPPSWINDGIRWMLNRFDMKKRDEER